MTILYNPATLFGLTPLVTLPPPSISPAYHASSLQFLASVHRGKSESLKLILAEHGWPTRRNSDALAEAGAFSIAHHSDYDLEFQIHCHELMLAQAQDGYSEHFGFLAYLTDRILCNKGLHQRFGTQIREADNGCFVPKAIEDIDHIDELRKQAGLRESQLEYMQRINGGDLLLYRPLVEAFADYFDHRPAQPQAPQSTVIEFPNSNS